MSSKYEPAARATAEWWADKVFGMAVAPVSTPEESQWHRDRGQTAAADFGDTTFMLHTIAKAQNPVAQDKRGEYVEAVTALLVENMLGQEARSGRIHMTVMTDYGSPYEFHQIDDRLGISAIRYPSKSLTNTKVDHVTAQFGYGAGDEIIWQAEDWVRPPCHQGAWDLTSPDGGRLPFKCSAPIHHALNQHVMDIPDPLCQAPDPYRPERKCLHSADDYHHQPVEPGGYMSGWAHEFVAPKES